MEKKTPLYDCHVSLGGRMVPFAGFLMPLQYKEGIIAEHNAVRSKAGIFDVSHMGEFIVSGNDATAALQRIVTRDLSGLTGGHAAYSPICNEKGGVIDDVLIYKFAAGNYMIVVNAANIEKDEKWMIEHLTGYDVTFENISDVTGQIAIQGPLSERILNFVTSDIPEKYYTFAEHVPILKTGKEALISRTGYTGEDGFEIYAEADIIAEIWNELIEHGKGLGLVPCGLGSRDTLRLEAAMPLYGHEMDETILPYEAGIGFFVSENKDFIGKDALMSKKESSCRRIGLVVQDRVIARSGADVFYNGAKVGVVTSGSQSPSLSAPICLARVDGEYAKHEHFSIEIRGKQAEALRVPLPFYKREK